MAKYLIKYIAIPYCNLFKKLSSDKAFNAHLDGCINKLRNQL